MGTIVSFSEKPIRISYNLRTDSAADRIQADIISAITGRHTYFKRSDDAPYVLTSSISLSDATDPAMIWGAGFARSDDKLGFTSPQNIRLLRGKASFEKLHGGGLRLPDLPLGDPLFLGPRLLGVTSRADNIEKIGFWGSDQDKSLPELQKILQMEQVLNLNLHGSPQDLLRDISGCSYILSTDVDGLILADSFNIPSLWIAAKSRKTDEDFAVEDWFSICARPQKGLWRVGSQVTRQDLTSACQTHDVQISCADLQNSFPMDKLQDLEETRLSLPLIPVEECRKRPVPVFVISFNRGRMTKKLFASLKTLDTPTDVVIHDNGSDDPNAIRALKELEEDGAKVVYGPKISTADELNNTQETISKYYEPWAEPQNFVVTDCDISIATCDTDYLDILRRLLNRFPQIACAGPMLKIDDISQNNPIYGHILTAHIRQFWQRIPQFVNLSGTSVAMQFCKIDTTFAMHRAGEPFFRLKDGIRTYEPYEARHLDWYQEEQEENYKTSSNAKISHWGNQSFMDRLSKANLPFDHFYRVGREPSGVLAVEKIQVNGTPLAHQQLESQVKQLEERLRQSQKRTAQLKDRIGQQKSLLVKKNRQISLVIAEKDEALQSCTALKKSLSWRLTTPLRRLRKFIR